VINPSQRPLPDNTQQSQQTNIPPFGGIRTHSLSGRAALDRAATGTGVTRKVVGLNTVHKQAASKPTKREKMPMGISYTHDHRLMALWNASIDSLTLSGCWFEVWGGIDV
jgi:hypothetical protein